MRELVEWHCPESPIAIRKKSGASCAGLPLAQRCTPKWEKPTSRSIGNISKIMRVSAISLFLAVLAVLGGCSRQSQVAMPPRDEVTPVKLEIEPQESPIESTRVLLVCNIASNDSIKLTELYAQKRKIPLKNIVQIDAPTTEEVGMMTFERTIQKPIRRAIAGIPNRIDYIVLTRGVPFRVDNSWGYSVDSLLVGMNKTFTPSTPKLPPDEEGRMEHANPYGGQDAPFSSERFGIYLVTRIDGYTLEDSVRMVEGSIKASPEKGPFLFDLAPNRFDSPRSQESSGWHQERMRDAATDLSNRGFKTIMEDPLEIQQQNEDMSLKDKFLAPPDLLMGYVSWGSNDRSFDLEKYRSLKFRSGSIAETYVSTSARTLIPTDDGQSLVGDLIQAGVTGVKGYVSEPWTIALARVDVLFDRYTRGYNLAESFYMSSQMIKWKDVVFGDPLCRPYGEYVDGAEPKIKKP